MKKAIISVISKQNEDDGDSIEVVTPGQYYEKNGLFYAVYKETEISGMEGTTTTLKISKDSFWLIRLGSTSTKMEFNNNKEGFSLYNTPYGVLQIKINTKELDINVDEHGGDVKVNYDLSVEGQQAHNTTLSIKIKA